MIYMKNYDYNHNYNLKLCISTSTQMLGGVDISIRSTHRFVRYVLY